MVKEGQGRSQRGNVVNKQEENYLCTFSAVISFSDKCMLNVGLELGIPYAKTHPVQC